MSAPQLDPGALATSTPHDPCATVRAWFDAFNRHDLDRMHALMTADAEFHPLRTRSRRYHGHQGLTDWFADVEHRFGPPDPIHIQRVRTLPDGRVLALGRLDNDFPFAAIHQLSHTAKISAARHYMSDEWMLEHLRVI